jgi:hypothetical protein
MLITNLLIKIKGFYKNTLHLKRTLDITHAKQ